MREAYDAAYSPPAPVLAIRVCRPGERVGAATAMRALVDSGADLTVLPAGVPEALDLPRVRVAEGATTRHALFAAQIDAGGRRLHVEVVGIGSEALVGRNLLAYFVTTLDGPAGTLRLR